MTTPALITLTNTDPEFYPTLGPFLARRDVARTVGGPIWDDDAKTWIVARDRSATVIGFAAVAAHGRRTTVESLYVHGDGWRDTARRLVAEAVARYGDSRDLHAVARHDMAFAYTAAGFTPTSTTKEFTRLTRPAGTPAEREDTR